MSLGSAVRNGWSRLGVAFGCLLVASAAAAAAASEPGLLDFSATEQQQIQRHGPWPPAPAFDAGNAQAGKPAAIALGRQLFFDARLSPDGRFACASCHAPQRAFSDGQARAMGRDRLDRNTPTLWNAVHGRWYGWDGAFDSLWSQALHPLRNPREMAGSAAQVQALLQTDPALACQFQRAFGLAPQANPDAETTLVQAAKALGAFVGSLQSGPTPFDRFRDALARGDARSAARYPLPAQRGLRLFIGRGQCSTCHVGALFSNGEFADIGAPFFVRPGVVDPGRHGGITALRASPYHLLGRHSDAPDGPAALKTRHVDLQHRNFGEFKVPSLRNVANTAPYLHDGQLATLDAVVTHYSTLNLDRLHADGEQILKPLQLDAGERSDLVAFLRSLSDPGATRWQRPASDAAPAQRCGKV
jgi:cytochrome c peroxidase